MSGDPSPNRFLLARLTYVTAINNNVVDSELMPYGRSSCKRSEHTANGTRVIKTIGLVGGRSCFIDIVLRLVLAFLKANRANLLDQKLDVIELVADGIN